MLTENEVVDVVCSWLASNGFVIRSRCHGTAKGDDIHAIGPGDRHLFVECKGEVSPDRQQLNHWRNASGAVFNAVRDALSLRPRDAHAIAIPDIAAFRDLFRGLEGFFSREHIAVFWVSNDGEVTVRWPARESRVIE